MSNTRKARREPRLFTVIPGALYGITGLPLLPVRRMHCDDMADNSRPVLWDGTQISPRDPAALWLGDACSDCDAAVFVVAGSDHVAVVSEHRATCPAFAAMMACRRTP